MAESAGHAPRFEVVGHLGGGGMADVYLARMLEGSAVQTVALKRIRLELGKDDAYALQFEREARICALLEHENIVSLRGSGRDAVGAFLALEYVEGHSLAHLIHQLVSRVERCPLPVNASIARDVAAGLLYAHRLSDIQRGVAGIIHRDISPGNILLGYSGIAKLSDFGIAKAIGATQLTHTGTVKGKIGYMAPELFEGQEASAASDVFSLGATLYHLTCGTPAFEGRTEGELLRAVLHAVPMRPRVLRPETPETFEAWLVGALKKKPAERPSLESLPRALGESTPVDAARHQVSELLRTLFPAGVTVKPLETVARSRATRSALGHRRHGRAPALLGAGALACAAIGAAALWLRRPPVPPPVIEVPAATPSTAPAPQPLPVQPPPEVMASPPPTPPPALRTPAKPTTLWVRVQPWARIFLDGELKGLTPKQPFPVTPGTHTLRLVNEELKASRTLQIHALEHRRNEVKVVLEREGGEP
jgi:serine/threonine protein kinase